MNNLQKEQIEKQIAFFNKNALAKKGSYFIPGDAFDWYAIRPVMRAMRFLYSNNPSYIYLDYGCGIGDSIEIFKISNGSYPSNLIGVDISGNAILEISQKYDYKFFHIDAEAGVQALGLNVDAAYMMHVLHHSIDHQKIIKDLSNSVKHGGRIAIVDIGSKNPFQEIGRKIFTLLPNMLKNKFKNDLLVNGEIPEKLPVDINKIKEYLQDEGFNVKLTYSSSVIFIFGWLLNILGIKISQNSSVMKTLFNIDEWISNHLFKEYSVLYLIEAERV